ncbi:hypothetical protein D9V28_04825 [Mycetocola zhadangensis]|uniref:Uncharacterized protein n=1 Tax=Mycetocola zhadangensis TaxID=1164595 RepID=A0A3L7J9M4_9MICO|nr:hypothetical protein D9V28_04825 [Mycetocola zhadangensis]
MEFVTLSFLSRMRQRPVASHGQDTSYSPPAEGCDLLGTGVDHLRAYLRTQPTRLETLEELCAPIGEHLRTALDEPQRTSSRSVFSHSLAAVAAGQPVLWEALLQDLLDATSGGPGLTVTPLLVLMSRAISNVLYDSDDNGLFFAASEARTTANRLVDELPTLLPAITIFVTSSRDAIGLRAARMGLDSVLLHRRIPNISAEDILALHRMGPLGREQLADPDTANALRAMAPFRTLSAWASDISAARDWPLGDDPGTPSSVVVSIRVPVTSLWFAPRSHDREFLISPEGVVLDHVEVLHRV